MSSRALAPQILTDDHRVTWEELYSLAVNQGVNDPTTQSFILPREAPTGMSLPNERSISELALLDGVVMIPRTDGQVEMRLNSQEQVQPGGVVAPNVVPAGADALTKPTHFAVAPAAENVAVSKPTHFA